MKVKMRRTIGPWPCVSRIDDNINDDDDDANKANESSNCNADTTSMIEYDST